MSSHHPLTKEQMFQSKLAELGLRATYKERTREQYGVTQHRLEIRILRHNEEVSFTTGGYWGATTYRESGFEQGLRKLTLLEQGLKK